MNDLPFNETLERALLIGILQDPTLLPQINQILDDEDFYRFSNKEIYHALNSIPVDEIDSLVIEDRLPNDSKDYFKDLVREGESLLPSFSNILTYAEEIKSKSILRQCIRMGSDIIGIGTRPGINAEEALTELEHKFADFIHSRVNDSRDTSTKEAFELFLSNLGTRITREGIKTGYFAIDMMLHRLEGLVVLAARPAMGKTALGINIARNVAEQKPVLFFSLEQSQEQIFERMLSSEAEVNLEDIRTGAFIGSPDSLKRISYGQNLLLNVMDRVHVDERAALSASHIASMSRQKKIEWGEIGLIVIDYLHIMSLSEKMKVDALGDAVRDLRALGKELGCPILLLAQLSRQPEMTEAGEDRRKIRRRPQLTDLRSSGEIEQVADVVMFLYRDSYYTGVQLDQDQIEVIIAKHKNGPTGTVFLDWYPKYVKFQDQN